MDIDIDFPPSFEVTKLFPQAVVGSRVQDGKLVKHPCGHYFQNVAVDKVTGLAAIPYDKAPQYGLFKIDFLHIGGILEFFENKEQLRRLIKHPPKWGLLERRDVVEKLFQLGRHYDLVSRVKPKSVEELADCIALIRPGKKHMIPTYVNSTNRASLRKQLYSKTEQPYYKKPHAISYALTIVVQLHLIGAGVI